MYRHFWFLQFWFSRRFERTRSDNSLILECLKNFEPVVLFKKIWRTIQHWLELAIREPELLCYYYLSQHLLTFQFHVHIGSIASSVHICEVYGIVSYVFLLTWYWQGYLNFEFYEVGELAINHLGNFGYWNIYWWNVFWQHARTYSQNLVISNFFFLEIWWRICRPLFFLLQKSVRCLR